MKSRGRAVQVALPHTHLYYSPTAQMAIKGLTTSMNCARIR